MIFQEIHDCRMSITVNPLDLIDSRFCRFLQSRILCLSMPRMAEWLGKRRQNAKKKKRLYNRKTHVECQSATSIDRS